MDALKFEDGADKEKTYKKWEGHWEEGGQLYTKNEKNEPITKFGLWFYELTHYGGYGNKPAITEAMDAEPKKNRGMVLQACADLKALYEGMEAVVKKCEDAGYDEIGVGRVGGGNVKEEITWHLDHINNLYKFEPGKKWQP